MTSVRVTRRIDAPPEEVFAAFADLPNAAERVEAIQSVEMLTDGPVGVGTRFRETRVMFGREASETMEITAFDPPHGYRTKAESHGCRYRADFTFTPSDGGTEVALDFHAEPLTFKAKVFSFLMKPMMKSVMTACAKDMEDVGAWLETRRSASGSH